MAKALGPRATVSVGKGKDGKAVYSFMLKSTAEYFGFQIAKTASRKGRSGRVIPLRGAVGTGSIKVPTGKTKKIRNQTYKLYKCIPMPGSMSIPKIQTFLKTAKKNKPDHFVTVDGRTYPVSS